MKAHRGQSLPLHSTHHKPGAPRASLGRLCWASVGPFLAAALIGSVLFRATGSGTGAEEVVVQRPSSRVLEETGRPIPCLGLNCGGHGAQTAATGAGAEGGRAAVIVGSSLGGSSSSEVGGGSGEQLPQLFLFIGILSGRGYRHRRLAVREAWSNKAQVPGQVVARFILSEDERTPQVEKELEAYGDIVFVREKTNYKSILYKTYYVMEYAATNYDAAFVLKTDDDAFINVVPLLAQLAAMCENPGCRRERVYMGKMAKHSEVLLQPGHKWNNAAFHNHTGLKEYPNYMMGGGYVVGGEVARLLVDIHTRMHLKFTPIEDATLGFWLMAMDLRHIDHPRFYTWAAPCCFKAPVRKPGERFVTRFQLAEEFDADLCSSDPWIIMHKIDSPTKMRYVGGRVANCSAPARPWELAPSIRPYITPEQLAYWQQRAPPEPPEQLTAGDGTPAADAGGSAGGASSGGLASSDAAGGGGLAAGAIGGSLASTGDASGASLASAGTAVGGVSAGAAAGGGSGLASAGAAAGGDSLSSAGAAGGSLGAAGVADPGVGTSSSSSGMGAATTAIQ